ncbi:hypothetical protein Q8A67_005658 [Cirrhinus molitorella]|uniref:Uncharacterized protein n=1 Tax=Cirrhinus molitorella TaxID=172907 RepID=A0AA88PWD1_9TELE|nr:hypothetical protein Q8A67_005658 [Cirrhinus molitorella]
MLQSMLVCLFLNQTTHLDISKHCEPCSGPQSTSTSTSNSPGSNHLPALISAAVVGSLLFLAAVGIFWFYRRQRKTNQEHQTRNEDITYADPTFYQRKAQKSGVKQEEEVVYAGIAMRS